MICSYNNYKNKKQVDSIIKQNDIYYLNNIIKQNQNNIYLMINNNKIDAIFNKQIYEDIAIAQFAYIKNWKNKESIMNRLYYYDKTMLIEYDYLNHSMDNYKSVNLCDKFNYEITRKYNLNYLIPKDLDSNILSDKFNKKYYPDIKTDQLEFVNIKGKQLDQFLQEDEMFSGLTKTDNGFYHFAGFHYLSLDDIEYAEDKNFLFAKKDNTLLGVIKYGTWHNAPYQSIAYIDVNRAYREQKIATRLVSELNHYLEKEKPLFLTQVSDMGKLCHMNDLFINNISVTNVVTYQEQMNNQLPLDQYIQQLQMQNNLNTNNQIDIEELDRS